MNYGVLKIVDGTYQQTSSNSNSTRGFSRMELGADGAYAPSVLSSKPGSTTLVIDLYYNDYAYLYAGRKAPSITSVSVSYSKSIRKLARSGNPLASATKIIADLAGCDEAHKVRGRAIALSRIRKTISGESFRFQLEPQ